eukprot:COSAG05_NODE_7928_length_754_cov_7.573271_1_plen_192_part_00
MRQMLAQLNRRAAAMPMATAVSAACTKNCLADLIIQTLVEKKKLRDVEWRRTACAPLSAAASAASAAAATAAAAALAAAAAATVTAQRPERVPVRDDTRVAECFCGVCSLFGGFGVVIVGFVQYKVLVEIAPRVLGLTTAVDSAQVRPAASAAAFRVVDSTMIKRGGSQLTPARLTCSAGLPLPRWWSLIS